VRGYDVILMIYANVGISKASVLTFCLLFSRTMSCSTIRYPQSEGLTSEGCIALLKAILQQILEDVLLAMRHRMSFEFDDTPAYYGQGI